MLNHDEESVASEASSAMLSKSVTPAPAARRKRTAVSISSSISGNTSDDGNIRFTGSLIHITILLLLGSYIPGQDFDPKSRQFSPEELRPQPMSKKSKKQVSRLDV